MVSLARILQPSSTPVEVSHLLNPPGFGPPPLARHRGEQSRIRLSPALQFFSFGRRLPLQADPFSGA